MCAWRVFVFNSRVLAGDINKSDLEKLVKDKEATELKAAETRRVRERLSGFAIGWSVCRSVGRLVSVSIFGQCAVSVHRLICGYTVRYRYVIRCAVQSAC